MRIRFDCVPCVCRQVELLTRQLYSDEDSRWRFFSQLFRNFLEMQSQGICPPQLAEMFFDRFTRESGIDDPFLEEKDKSTQLAREVCRKYEKQDLSFDEALLLAISGNIIDFGVNPEFQLETAKQLIDAACHADYDRAAAADLHRRMDGAKRIFYILDNCGEAVLDGLLLRLYRDRITLGVRGGATLNDVTRRELDASGLGDYPVVDTGRRIPGAPLADVCAEFREELQASDLVIAKGQGNLESLCPDFTARPIYHLLRIKCPVISDWLKKPIGSIAIYGRNLDR